MAIKETARQDSEKDVTVETRIHEPDSDDSLIEETMILHNWLLLTQQICLIMQVI